MESQQETTGGAEASGGNVTKGVGSGGVEAVRHRG